MKRTSAATCSALLAFALTASSTSAETITLRCNVNYAHTPSETTSVVIDTELRSVSYEGQAYTWEGRTPMNGDTPTHIRVSRLDNEMIVFGEFLNANGTSPVVSYSINRITGALTGVFQSGPFASGQCGRAQAAF